MRERPAPRRTISGFQSMSSKISQTKSSSKRSLSPVILTEEKPPQSGRAEQADPDAMHKLANDQKDNESLSYKPGIALPQDVTRSFTKSKRVSSFGSGDFRVRQPSLLRSSISSSSIQNESRNDIDQNTSGKKLRK